MSEEPTIPSTGTLVRPNENCGSHWIGQLAIVDEIEVSNTGTYVWMHRLSDGGRGYVSFSEFYELIDIAGEEPSDG